jgi:phosphopantetheine adenylyltransferase
MATIGPVSSMIKYTDQTLVNQRLDDKCPFTTTEVENMIEQAEAYLLALMKDRNITFDSTKREHLILQQAATAKSALMVLGAMSISDFTLEETLTKLNVLYDELMGTLKLLADQQIIDWVEGQ